MALVKLLAGVAILSVGLRRLQASPVHRLAWQLTGFTFVLGGGNALIQTGIFAPWAYFSGEGTPVYVAFLRWNPAITQSRTFLMIGLGLVLSLLPLLSRSKRNIVPSCIGFLLLAMGAGGIFGWLEGGYVSSRFYPSTAMANLLELIILLSALFIALTVDTLDRYLWLALLVYSISIGLNVLWYAGLAWIRVRGAWAPPPYFVQLFLIVAHATMLGLALRRLRLSREGIKVGGLLEPVAGKPVSMLR